MRSTRQNNLKVRGVATQEVYISMEEALSPAWDSRIPTALSSVCGRASSCGAKM